MSLQPTGIYSEVICRLGISSFPQFVLLSSTTRVNRSRTLLYLMDMHRGIMRKWMENDGDTRTKKLSQKLIKWKTVYYIK